MGKYYSDEEKQNWRKQAGYQSTSDVIRAEKEAREQGGGSGNVRQISQEEADRMLSGGVAGESKKADRMIRLLEMIEVNTRNAGRIA